MLYPVELRVRGGERSGLRAAVNPRSHPRAWVAFIFRRWRTESGVGREMRCFKIVLHHEDRPVRDLRNHYTSLLRWLQAGEEILITQKGVAVARLLPAGSHGQPAVNWADSPEVRRDRSRQTKLSSTAMMRTAGGR